MAEHLKLAFLVTGHARLVGVKLGINFTLPYYEGTCMYCTELVMIIA